LVVEDFDEFRALVCLLLQPRAEFQVELASDGLEAVQKAEALQPDLILLDIGLPKLNGIEVSRRVNELAPAAKILFVSVESDSDLIRAALRLGAGYVHKPRVQNDLLPAIEAVFKGERFVSDGLIPSLPLDPSWHDSPSVLSEVVDRAMKMACADKAILQIFNPETNALHIVAQFGFSRQFLEFFDRVEHNQGSSGTALALGQRVIVDDVASDPIFQGTSLREVVLGEGVRAVQSIPLKTLSGRLLGVLSTHFKVAKPLRQHLLSVTDAFAQEVAELIQSKLASA
jgi:DNA-binding NarL/FixJ family response regulator